ncbi:UNVERIFIED_CONTAM: hypothetical protein Sindi_2510900 [Sesamum indicum]
MRDAYMRWEIGLISGGECPSQMRGKGTPDPTDSVDPTRTSTSSGRLLSIPLDRLQQMTDCSMEQMEKILQAHLESLPGVEIPLPLVKKVMVNLPQDPPTKSSRSRRRMPVINGRLTCNICFVDFFVKYCKDI